MKTNVHNIERIASVGIGGILIATALGRRSGWLDAALGITGVALAQRGLTGYCSAYDAMGVSTAPSPKSASDRGLPHARQPEMRGTSAGRRVERSVDVNASVERVYKFWRNLENIPKVMEHVREVRTVGEDRSHWVVDGPFGETYEWDAEIIRDVPNHLIAWESLPGAQANNAGTVFFEGLGAGGCRLRVILNYNPPAGQAGDIIARLIGGDPESRLASDLHRFKEYIEKTPAEAMNIAGPTGGTPVM